ncbi:MAG: ATP-binding protein [Gammaproteobacteria bacterium]
MAWLKNLPIKLKLIAMMTITSSIAMVLMALAIAVNKAVAERDTLMTELGTLAQIIGSRTTGALTFDDARTAAENLNALKANGNIIRAAIFQHDGSLFAEFRSNGLPVRDNVRVGPVLKHALGQFFSKPFSDTMSIVKDILLEGEKIGEIHIVSSLDTFYANLANYLSWVAVIGVACFIVSLMVAAKLHHLISDPVLELYRTTDWVSKKNDYAVRIRAAREDELGMLIDGFNHMLKQIQIRDQALAHYSTELESQVAERTHELFESNQRRINWLENMARFLKHELKNATVGIRTSLELMERRLSDESLEVYLQRAGRSLRYMNVLLENVSNASSLEASVYKEALYPLNLSELIVTQLDEYRSIYPDFTLSDRCEPDILVNGNKDRLKQMLDKLISNAFEHCREGTPIRVLLAKDPVRARLTISNEGVGLPENKERIFDLFVSLRDEEHRKNDSLGLGLYLVKLIAESHGGSVYAEDLEEREGAVFNVMLPLFHPPEGNRMNGG